jgi:hypothetical protein
VVKWILLEMDEQWPVIPRQAAKRRGSGIAQTPLQRLATQRGKFRRRGWLPIAEVTAQGGGGAAKLADFALAGIRVMRDLDNMVWAPYWTEMVKLGDVATLKRCRRNVYERRVMLSRAALSRESE